MEQGFVVDESYGRRLVSNWTEGAPEYWMWNVAVRGKRQLEIATYRCSRCGCLEGTRTRIEPAAIYTAVAKLLQRSGIVVVALTQSLSLIPLQH